MIRVLIADDHPVFRRGVKQIISETMDIVAGDEVSNGLEALKKVRENEYAVVLLDITMPGENGVDVLKQLRIEKPRLPVLMLTMHPEEQYAVRALRAGAAGYLTKESAPAELVIAIRKVAAGGKYVSSALAEKLATLASKDSQKLPHENLSDREYQILCLIASGKTVSQIAQDLSLSIKTISTYRTRLLKKMGMENNAEMTHYAFTNHIVV